MLFYGIKRLPKELASDGDLQMIWMGMAQRIRQQNARLFMDSAKVCKNFKQEEFRFMLILKNNNTISIAQSMGYANEFASQSRFYASYGLSRKVMSASEPFGDF